MSSMRLLLLFIWCCYNLLVLSAEGDATSSSDSLDNSEDNLSGGGVVFEMTHRHSPAMELKGDSVGPPKSRLDRTRQLLEGDNGRRRIHKKRLKIQHHETAWIPVHSGSDFGQGQYFVSLRVGSPHPQKIILVTDTASDLTWMNCQYTCKDCPKSNPHLGRIFRASQSSSFKTIPCASELCKGQLSSYFSVIKCPSPNTPCIFDYKYIGGQHAIGIFANETLTVGLHNRQKVRLHDVLIGCTKKYNESEGFPDGVMGLGFDKNSLSMRLAETFGNKFSYCLVDHLSSSDLKNYLSFGEVPLVEKPKMEYTDLLLGYIGSFYAVNVTGISVGNNNKLLSIPSRVWEPAQNSGMIIDSGTSLTYLSGEAYDEVADAFKPVLSKFESIGNTGSNVLE
ncbi:Eukaryotic aspartyl protease family protein [Euphorbia peplus]|nr:Eukaryotic aspartyl protease family protein [Euphorbia peplus]